MASSTIFKNFASAIEHKSLIVISGWIASDKYKNEVEKIRSLIEQGKHEEAQDEKKQLLAFTPSATFKEKRLLTHIDQYSGFIHLDFDDLSVEELEKAFQVISESPYTFFCFRSPSGNGLKVFVEVTTNKDHHDIAYKQVMQYYENITSLKADEKCKDITRLCFMSYDPKMYKTLEYKKFEINTLSITSDHTALEISQPSEEIDYTPILQDLIYFTEQKSTYTDHNRNVFIYLFASNCNRKGIPKEIGLQFALNNYDLPKKEIYNSFDSSYNHHSHEFAKFANFAKLQTFEESQPAEDFLKNTPSIPKELYLKMPDIIRNGAMAIIDFRERDVFLTGALAILSGCLPGVKGTYAGQEVFPNLFSFVIAPAASGKGALKFAKMLADEYHNIVLKKSREEQIQYDQKVAEYKQKCSSKKKDNNTFEELPIKPNFKVVYIPANTSYAKILWHLEQNEGSGIVCETEADTLGNVFKQEWGSYSDMLRKSFHHERISSSRKQNNEFTEVNTPSLSIALSGTFNQVTGLIASAEDGLFSRFLFYSFKVDQIWRDVSPNANNINLTEHFKELSKEVVCLVSFLEKQETEVLLTDNQWQQLNHQCEIWLNDITMFTAEEAASIVKRLGLILYRITMLFTALRKFENAEDINKMICTDEDFNISIELARIYLHHNILMFNNLPKQNEATQFKTGDSKRQCFEALPTEFTRQQAVEVGKTFRLSARTVDNILHNATGKMLTKIKAGRYRKI